MNKDSSKVESLLERIAAALERRHAHGEEAQFTLAATDAFVWEAERSHLVPVKDVAALPLSLLKGIDRARDVLSENTRRFAAGLPANNALLSGARGMGKSSLVKAVHAEIGRQKAGALKLIEIHREEIESLPALMSSLRGTKQRFIVFCDDLSFEAE